MSVVSRDQLAAPTFPGVHEVEFEELLGELSATSEPTAAPDWLERVGSPRRQVHRTAPEGTTRVELPAIEVVLAEPEPEPEPTPEELEAAEVRRNDAIAFAVGYRAGHSEGIAIGTGQGHREGMAVGRREAFAESRAAAAAVLDRIELQLAGHAASLDEIGAAIAASATELAVEIAEAVLARELAVTTTPGADAIVRAARLLPDTGSAAARVVVRLHPDDLATLGGSADSLLPGRSIELVADPAVTRGDCVLDAGATRVDASVAAAMARVREVLFP
jgi:flagellar assembly protein FliH